MREEDDTWGSWCMRKMMHGESWCMRKMMREENDAWRKFMHEEDDAWGKWCARKMMHEEGDALGRWCTRKVMHEGVDAWRRWSQSPIPSLLLTPVCLRHGRDPNTGQCFLGGIAIMKTTDHPAKMLLYNEKRKGLSLNTRANCIHAHRILSLQARVAYDGWLASKAYHCNDHYIIAMITFSLKLSWHNYNAVWLLTHRVNRIGLLASKAHHCNYVGLETTVMAGY